MSDQLVRQVAILVEVVKNNSKDVRNLMNEVREVRHELRNSIIELRGDLALSTSRQNGAIEQNKKKSVTLPNAYKRY